MTHSHSNETPTTPRAMPDDPALGPSDSSDSGSDVAGQGMTPEETTDRHGTGERAGVEEPGAGGPAPERDAAPADRDRDADDDPDAGM